MNERGSGRLDSIDVLRGIAALSVVCFHAMGNIPFTMVPGSTTPFAIMEHFAVFLSRFGGAGVVLFFVISGFCIHLKVAGQYGSQHLQYPVFFTFWRRRFLRLYPPYFVCFVLFLLAQHPLAGLKTGRLSAYDIFMHIFMLHNLDVRTVFSIMPVAWTLAVEEQLYLAYFLMLFLRNRYRWAIILGVALFARAALFCLGFLLHRGFGIEIPVEFGAAHWFAWILGALAVEIHVTKVALPSWTRSLWVFGVLAFLAGTGSPVPLAFFSHKLLPWMPKFLWFATELVWASAFFVLVNCLAHKEDCGALHFGVAGNLLKAVGVFSYSLYLTHDLLIRFILAGPQMTKFWFALFLAIPLCLCLAFLYYRLVERPFTNLSRGRHPALISPRDAEPVANPSFTENSSVLSAQVDCDGGSAAG